MISPAIRQETVIFLLAALHGIFREVMKRKEDKVDPIRSTFGRIEREEVNLTRKIMDIQTYGAKHRNFSFRDFLMKQPGKMEVIVTFLGILELMKMGQIEISQEEKFGDIRICFTADEIKDVDGEIEKSFA